MRRFALLACTLALGCATGEDPTATPTIRGDSAPVDASGGEVTADATSDSSPVDSTVVDSSTPTDTGADTSVPIDTGADTGSTDTGATDTGKVDTGSITDTGSTTDSGGCAIQGCLTSSTDRLTCATARTISRKTAGTITGGYLATITMLPATSSITDGTLTCLALGPDHAYKLFMRKGETATVVVSDSADAGVKWNTLFWESGDCTTNSCTGSPSKCGGASGGTYGATADGWVTIMVSGQSPLDFGQYTIKVTLSCKTTDCECP